MNKRHRQFAASLLNGNGLEIGALNSPFEIPKSCQVKYLDLDTVKNLSDHFPELNPNSIISPDYIGDIEKTPIIQITKQKFDFIIANHVIEHMANPIMFIKNVWDTLNDSGCFILSSPDKDYTFDITREITTFEHILNDYRNNVTDVEDEHYIDFFTHVYPNSRVTKPIINSLRARKEHVHVWNSDQFSQQLKEIFKYLNMSYTVLFESFGIDNQIEYFCVIQKGSSNVSTNDIALKILLAIYKDRADLKRTFSKMEELLKWAYTAGCTFDSDNYILRNYRRNYEQLFTQFENCTIKECLWTYNS